MLDPTYVTTCYNKRSYGLPWQSHEGRLEVELLAVHGGGIPERGLVIGGTEFESEGS